MKSSTLPLVDPRLADLIGARLDQVEARLHEAVSQADVLADSASRHLVQAGGKRLRPLLTLLTAQLGDATRQELIDAAVVVELTHLASLYHDDVMDSAQTRRGALSAHEVWGNSVAIITGDLLFAKASMVVAKLGPEAVYIQAETFERLCLGQLSETAGPVNGEDPVEHYLKVLSDKTASLIASSARFGAMFAGCSQDVISTVVRYGELIGVAFQLADDVIDVMSDGGLTGKTPGTDFREGVPTLPSLLLRRYAEAGDVDAARIVDMLDGDLSSDEALSATVTAIRLHPVMGEVQEAAQRYAQNAIAELADLEPSPVRDELVRFAEALVDRSS